MFNTITILNIKTNNVLLTLDQFSMKIFKKNLQKNNKWKVSYVSGLNFTENKQKYLYKQCAEEVILSTIYLSSKNHHRTLCTFRIKNPLNYHIQIRGFKTKYNVKPGSKKESSFTNKFKKFIGSSSETNKGVPQVLKEKNLAAIQNILNNQTLTEEQRKMIMAFIEGYESGFKHQTPYRNPILSWLKLFNLTVAATIFALVWYITYIVASSLRFSFDNLKIRPEVTNITFADVKGVRGAKQELEEIVQFLKHPKKFTAIGAKLPKGVLLVGSPGTGKTLLARAVAGEASVPFFHASGSEFEEVLVGQGARRIRDLFKAAKEKAPAVIFIDEIDSVGARRSYSTVHPYANQTINQLLTEMDGFVKNEGVIVLGATNRPDDLDEALLRPGRFDVEVHVPKPDYLNRKEIFDFYLSKVSTQNSIDSDCLARTTIGFTGADIENMVNQAALKAAISEEDCVTMKHLEYAKDKLLLGREEKINQDREAKLLTAYHEAGHALVAYYTKNAKKIYKITIVSHRDTLGHTSLLPEKDETGINTKSELIAEMDTAMGGRAAEEFIFGSDKVTTGSQSDFHRATEIAEKMVNCYGMSEKVGFRQHLGSKDHYEFGPSKKDLIDSEVKRLLEESYERAIHVLQQHPKELKKLADALMKYETLSSKDAESIITGQNYPK